MLSLVWLLRRRRPALFAAVRQVAGGGDDLGRAGHVRVALGAHGAGRLAGLGGRAVHLQAAQLADLEAALVHDAAVVRAPRVGAIARRFT